MQEVTSDITRQMHELGICVIIPTYNNAGTLARVVQGCMRWTAEIIVVNDGCTDTTADVLATLAHQVSVVAYTPNRGKGYALKQGLAHAKDRGYHYAITIDADGQHDPDDIPHFVEAIAHEPDALIIGSRDLQAENMPGKNTFANKFSNFWFTVQTLQTLPDTQTGYRLYPLRRMGSLWWLTSRYEAELEMLVVSAWHGVRLIPIPIHVYYPKPEERVSHFRPGMDFFRISVVNTVLCLLAIVYGGPRMLFHKLTRKRS